MIFSTKQLGLNAENIAYRYLKQQGLNLIKRNFACRCGEIDLIMQQNETLVFVEVRFRHSDQFGQNIETIDYRKQTKLIKTAQFYLQIMHLEARPCRFDVVGIRSARSENLDKPFQDSFAQVEWIKNAF